MQADFAANIDVNTLLDSSASVWDSAKEEVVSMMGTPAAMQPTPAIRETWSTKNIGSVSSVKVRVMAVSWLFVLSGMRLTTIKHMVITLYFPMVQLLHFR